MVPAKGIMMTDTISLTCYALPEQDIPASFVYSQKAFKVSFWFIGKAAASETEQQNSLA